MQQWDRQPDESEAAYAAFVAYRDLGVARSIRAAYQQIRGPQSSPKAVPSGSFKTWATAHRWVERARAWDNRQQRVADKAIEKVVAADATARTREQIRDERRLRHEELEYIAGANLWRQAIASLAAMPPGAFDAKFVVAAMALASKLGRSSLRMPVVVEDDIPSDFDSIFYVTKGQLASQMPPGSVPQMPADIFVKPDFSSAVDTQDGNGAAPDPRNRKRPHDPRMPDHP